MPLLLRLVVLFLVGAGVARLANWFSWWLVQMQRPLYVAAGRGLEQATEPSRAGSRLPIIGSWQSRRWDETHPGPSGWRPLIVEVLLGLVFAGLYLWEVPRFELVRPQAPAGFVPAQGDWFLLHAQFISHLVLITLMLVASLVDIDEQTIPDLITVPGTLLGFLAAAALPASLLPVVEQRAGGPVLAFLTLASPNDPPADLAPRATVGWLAVALFCFALWCLALLPWPRRGRRGWRRALSLMMARWRRDPLSIMIVACGAVGAALITAVWFVGGESWLGLVSSLVGMAGCGGLIWAVRVAAGWALAREAMGFGDVTLMAMIGSFLGWQTSPMVFFLAPLAGLVVGLIQWFAYRDNVIPYGPFLCLATLVVIVKWGALWAWAAPLYDVPWLVPASLSVCLVLLAVMLRAWRAVRETLLGA